MIVKNKKPTIKTAAPLMKEACNTIECLTKERDELKSMLSELVMAIDCSSQLTIRQIVEKAKKII